MLKKQTSATVRHVIEEINNDNLVVIDEANCPDCVYETGHSDADSIARVTLHTARDNVTRWLAAMNSGNNSLIGRLANELYAADYVWHFPGFPDKPLGPGGLTEMASMIHKDNPDLRIVLEDIVAEGDKSSARYTIYRADPVTRKPQRASDMVISRCVNGKFAEDWELLGPWEDMA